MGEIVLPYRPTDKQLAFHASGANEVLYGGAAGGGKSKAIVMDALAMLHTQRLQFTLRRVNISAKKEFFDNGERTVLS